MIKKSVPSGARLISTSLVESRYITLNVVLALNAPIPLNGYPLPYGEKPLNANAINSGKEVEIKSPYLMNDTVVLMNDTVVLMGGSKDVYGKRPFSGKVISQTPLI